MAPNYAYSDYIAQCYFIFLLLLVACFGVAHIYRLVTNILSSHCRLVYLYLEISPIRFVSSFFMRLVLSVLIFVSLVIYANAYFFNLLF